MLAYVVLTSFTRITLSADELRTRSNGITRSTDGHIGPDSLYDSRILMPLNNRVECCRMFSVPGMDFTATDANPLYLQKNFVRAKVFRLGCRYILKYDVFWLCKYCLSHFLSGLPAIHTSVEMIPPIGHHHVHAM